jgi:uncharacterized protein (TIGR02118 family)
MYKVIALYRAPEDPAAFEQHYQDVHMPLAGRLPGLRRCELGWVQGGIGGEPRYHLVAELYFDDLPTLQAALKSPEGAATAADVALFAGALIHLMIARVEVS